MRYRFFVVVALSPFGGPNHGKPFSQIGLNLKWNVLHRYSTKILHISAHIPIFKEF